MKLRKIEKEILEVLNEGKEKRSGRYEGKADLRKVITDGGKYTSGQFNYAIRKLKDLALIKSLKSRGIYAITDRGKTKLANADEVKTKEYAEEKKVTVKKRIPDEELSDFQLVQRIKAEYPQEDKQSLYSRFVQHRNLKPKIDAKEFYKLFDEASPNFHVKEESVNFTPTHINKGNSLKVMMWKEEGNVWRFVDEAGGTGSTPEKFLNSHFERIYEEESPRWKKTGFRKYSLYVDGDLNSALTIGELKDKDEWLVNLTNYKNHWASDHRYFDTLEEAEKFAADYMENQEEQLAELKDMGERIDKLAVKRLKKDQKRIDSLRKDKIREYEALIRKKGDTKEGKWAAGTLSGIENMNDEEFMTEYYPEELKEMAFMNASGDWVVYNEPIIMPTPEKKKKTDDEIIAEAEKELEDIKDKYVDATETSDRYSIAEEIEEKERRLVELEEEKVKKKKRIASLRKGKIRENEAFIQEMKDDPKQVKLAFETIKEIETMNDEEFMKAFYPERKVRKPKKNEERELTEDEKKAMEYLARETGFLNTVKDY